MSPADLKSQIEHSDFTDAQRTNSVDLLELLYGLGAPHSVSINSYDGGFSIHWDRYEVAVYGDRYETYQLGSADSVIHHWPRLPGQPVDPAMMNEIRAATISNDS